METQVIESAALENFSDLDAFCPDAIERFDQLVNNLCVFLKDKSARGFHK